MQGAFQQRVVPRLWSAAASSTRRELRRLSSTTPPQYCRDCRRREGLLSTVPRSSYSSTTAASAIHDPSIVRNVAVIAHVDHGKTTLVDQLIKTGLLGEEAGGAATAAAAAALDGSRALDSGALEKERGITIMSKTTRVDWGGHILNLVDTPGHSDFGGEVERVLSMVDGAVLVVDATEGVMSQTKFVVSRAIKQGLKFVVVLNKADRDTARLGGEVEDEIFDLLVAMDATDEQLDFPIIYASAKEGWCVEDTAHVDPLARKAALGPQGLDTGWLRGSSGR